MNLRTARALPDVSDLVAAGRFTRRTLPNGREVIRVEKILPVEYRAPVEGEQPDRITVTVSDETLDRYGDIILADGWSFENYLRNPVWLVDHSYLVESIIGQGENPRIENGRLVLENVLDPAGSGEATDLVRAKLATGSLRAVSVGFLPYAWEKILDEEQEWTGGFRFTAQDLLEVSWVAVPANPYATLEPEKTLRGSTSEKTGLVAGPGVPPAPRASRVDAEEETEELFKAVAEMWATAKRRG